MIRSAIYTLLKQKALYAFLLMTFSLSVAAQNISLKMENKPLSEVLSAITQATGYKFVYSDALTEIHSLVSIDCSNKNLREVLDEILKGKKISSKIDGKNVALSPTNVAPQRTGDKGFSIKGIVTDETGELLPGVAVKNNRSNKVVASDLDGNYEIEAFTGDVLLFTSIGMSDKNVTVSGKSERLNVVLSTDVIALNDVVVTGYQTLSKERSTGSYAVVSSDKIQQKMSTNIMSRLEGSVAGLNMNRNTVEIRGVSTISGTKTPLYVVDGVPFEGGKGTGTGVLDVINPADIVNVTVLKDATAASIYGARSANGVIVITTRTGQTGKTRVNYNGSVNFRGLPDRDYSNRMNSSELIDYMVAVNESNSGLRRPTQREWQDDIQGLILDQREGKISKDEFDRAVAPYRERDRYDQVVNEFLRTKRVVQQHNIAFSGGSDIYKYSVSANYTGTAPYQKPQYDNRIGFNIKNTFNFFKWFQLDAGILGSTSKGDYDNGIDGLNGYLNTGPASYYMLRDEAGSPLQMYTIGSPYKSQYEIDRLKSLGMQDETFIPVNEMDKSHSTYKTNYLNINLGARFNIIEGLTATVRYQNERTTGFTKQYNSKDAYSVKRMINDATQIDKKTGAKKFNVPQGGQLQQNNTDNFSYTVRGQLDYNKQINKNHSIQALAGGEVRKIVTSGHGYYRVGYDDDNLSWSEIDALTMSKMLSGTESIGGTYTFPLKNPTASYKDNRYVSFYANASWNYKERLSLTASIRMDQSNLFGTDPKYQYRPLWSAGAHYVVLKNYKNWLDRLAVRATYGINGNVAKNTGPYLIAVAESNNYFTNEYAMSISSPPNDQLRWEKTNVVNIGVDFNMFRNRLNGAIEFYNKKTVDLLGDFSIDPTLGWSSVQKNFASMFNRGVEISLNSVNIDKKDFRWTTNFIFSYNKNEITEIESSNESAYSYYSKLNNRKGYPMDAVFAIRYKGLDEKGFPVALKADGSECKNSDELTKEDLVYKGTYNPPYYASLSNTLYYKGVELSFMFVYSGGHVMRDVAAGYLLTMHPTYTTSNTDKNMMNYWKNSGDENNPNTNPAYMFQSQYRNATQDIWKAADKHIQRGDFIKLRDLTVAYNLPSYLLKSTFISGVKVSFQARNLFYWAANDKGLDPEVWSGSSLSPGRGTRYPAEFIVGLNLNF